MTRLRTAVLMLMWAPGLALGCGACIEDKVAATYDHALIEGAIASDRHVVFVAIEGPVDAAKVAGQIVARAPRVKGVQPRSVRTSISPAAFSFVLDRGQDPRAAIASFRTGIDQRDARFVAIKLVRDGKLRDPD